MEEVPYFAALSAPSFTFLLYWRRSRSILCFTSLSLV
jgi:hypothetical protein